MGNLIPRRRSSTLARLHDNFFEPMQQEIEQHFQNMWREMTGETGILDGIHAAAGYPKLNCYQKDGEFFVEATVPGVQPEDVEVQVQDRDLSITVRSQNKKEGNDGRTTYIQEIRRSESTRLMTLPDNLEGDPTAEIKDGILTLKWKCVKPPEPTVPTPKKIEVKKVETK